MINKEQMELSLDQVLLVSGGKDDEDGFWYAVGKFFADQANCSDSIYETYGNTNRNHIL